MLCGCRGLSWSPARRGRPEVAAPRIRTRRCIVKKALKVALIGFVVFGLVFAGAGWYFSNVLRADALENSPPDVGALRRRRSRSPADHCRRRRPRRVMEQRPRAVQSGGGGVPGVDGQPTRQAARGAQPLAGDLAGPDVEDRVPSHDFELSRPAAKQIWFLENEEQLHTKRTAIHE